MKTEAQIQRRAMRVLKQVGIATPPVEVREVAKFLGAEVRPEYTDEEVSGALYRLPEGPVIGVNAAHHMNRQRFTIAHECGHLVLHDEAVFVDRTYPSGRPSASSPAFLRDAVSSEAVDPVEIEANRFAASLLMPRAFLLKDLKSEALPLDAESVARLADQYKVSTQAMTYRLTNLGVPLDIA